MKELETKDSSKRFEVKTDDEEGKVSGFLSTFGNVDLIDDIVEAGAFKRTLNSLKKSGLGLKMLIQHSTNHRAGMFSVGGKDGLKETDEGLFTPGASMNLETTTGREGFSDVKFGLLDTFSIGFIPERVEFVRKSVNGEKRMIRRILEIRLMEGSLAVFPANPKAVVTGTKSRWEEVEEKRAIPVADFSFAPRDKVWDATASERRVRTKTGAEEGPNARYRKRFLWFDAEDPDSFGSYKLPIVDVVDGQLKFVFRGLAASAAALRGARGGVQIPSADRAAVIRNVNKLYAKARKEFDDENIVSPFEKASPIEVITSDLAALLKGPVARKSDPDSLFADIRASLDSIKTTLKGV